MVKKKLIFDFFSTRLTIPKENPAIAKEKKIALECFIMFVPSKNRSNSKSFYN